MTVSHFVTCMEKNEPISSENFIPNQLLIASLLVVWLIANVAQNGGINLLGNTSFIVIPISLITMIMIVVAAIVVGDIGQSLHHFSQPHFNKLCETKDWIVAAGHAVFILNVSTGGFIKLASSRPFRLPILRDVIIIAVTTLLFHAVTLFSVTAIIDGYAARLYPYDNHDERFRHITQRRSLVMATVAEAFVGVNCDWIMNAFYFLGISRPTVTKARDRPLGAPETTSTLHRHLFDCRDRISRQLTIHCAWWLCAVAVYFEGKFPEHVDHWFSTARHRCLYLRFRRFSVNIRTMVGGSGPINIFWWLNWTVVSPFVHLVCYVAFFTVIGHKQWFDTMWLIVFMSTTIAWLPINFILKNYERMESHQPFRMLFQPRSDWGPLYLPDRSEATTWERALRFSDAAWAALREVITRKESDRS
ncbi:hypothetical protein KIN20_024193 [Parelaphostrongylus tenuis]|uniref:Uncharacterized protein n=1 Tax=Parelaphostrongylus tenuis TaxID=148309 RepID=A0AAD5QTG8_PARTN|nr:hypothetical protein KIN20_024193 [Parelaphostrongylus tenuis]